MPSLRYLELLLVAVLVLLVLPSGLLRGVDVLQVLLGLHSPGQPLANLLGLASHLHIMLVRITTGTSPFVSSLCHLLSHRCRTDVMDVAQIHQVFHRQHVRHTGSIDTTVYIFL